MGPRSAIVGNDEDKNEITDAMEQVACDVHTETVKKHDKDTDKDYERDSNDDIDDNEDPDKIRG